MPEISRFYGIIITINYNEHNPPHFHARYGEEEVTIGIKSGIIEGKMSKRTLKMILEWYELYQEELMENWELAQARKPLNPIQPLR